MKEITAVSSLEALNARFPPKICNDARGVTGFHLFHAPNSVCSQKVRSVLFEAGAAFYSHEINIGAGENYDPDYVKARAQACAAKGFRFASGHNGSTSVTETGCDACVVPTLIDDTTAEVLIDSLHICVALDEKLRAELRPPLFADAVAREIAIVDRLPNYPLLAARLFGVQADGGNPFAMGKVRRCNALIEAHADDPLLVAAFAAKRDKELEAAQNLFTPSAIAQSERDMRTALQGLADRLPSNSAFLFSDRITLADIFWAIELIRNRDLGYGAWVDALPRLHAYEAALCATPCIERAILNWPAARIQWQRAS